MFTIRRVRLTDIDNDNNFFQSKLGYDYDIAHVIVDFIKVPFPVSYLKLNNWEDKEGYISIIRKGGIVDLVIFTPDNGSPFMESIAQPEETEKLDYIFQFIMGKYLPQTNDYGVTPQHEIYFTTPENTKNVFLRKVGNLMHISYIKNLTLRLKFNPNEWWVYDETKRVTRYVNRADRGRVLILVYRNRFQQENFEI